jgi:YD repeat-containing protein
VFAFCFPYVGVPVTLFAALIAFIGLVMSFMGDGSLRILGILLNAGSLLVAALELLVMCVALGLSASILGLAATVEPPPPATTAPLEVKALPIVGTWESTQGRAATMTFERDGKWSSTTGGVKKSGRWKEAGAGRVTVTDADGKATTLTYQFDGDTLAVTDDAGATVKWRRK